jgi:uncharacterized membrane protein
MESRAKLLGHAIHPIMIVYPLGLLSTAAVFDILYLLYGTANWAVVSYWMIASGLLGGVIAAIFGLIDYVGIPSGTRAKSIGLLHGLTNVAVLILVCVELVTEKDAPSPQPRLSPFRSPELQSLLSAGG